MEQEGREQNKNQAQQKEDEEETEAETRAFRSRKGDTRAGSTHAVHRRQT